MIIKNINDINHVEIEFAPKQCGCDIQKPVIGFVPIEEFVPFIKELIEERNLEDIFFNEKDLKKIELLQILMLNAHITYIQL